MNSVQMHLALTHVPVILSLVGLIMLIVALFIKNSFLTKTSYVIIALAGLAAIPVFFSGEGTEEAVENIPGISEVIVERHEKLAEFAMISIGFAGILAMAAIISSRWFFAALALRYMVLIMAVISGLLMAQTAHLGGQIRHSEINNSAGFQNELAVTENDARGIINQDEKNDD